MKTLTLTALAVCLMNTTAWAGAKPVEAPKPTPVQQAQQAPEPKPAPVQQAQQAPEPKPAPVQQAQQAPEPKPAPVQQAQQQAAPAAQQAAPTPAAALRQLRLRNRNHAGRTQRDRLRFRTQRN